MADKRELIRALECEWRDALCAKDVDRLRTLIHPDFMLIGTRSTGPFMLNRDEWLDAIQKRELISIDLEIRDAVVFEQMMVGTIAAQLARQISRRRDRGLRAADRRVGLRRRPLEGGAQAFEPRTCRTARPKAGSEYGDDYA